MTTSSAIGSDAAVPHAVGAAAASVWGDETEIAAAAVALASRRISKPSDPKTTARPASELLADAGQTITPEGLGADEALRIFEDVMAPATRAQDDPMNLAYIPAAPTRAALAFDAVVSSYNIFAGTWESGAGAIFAENQALAWLVELLGWPETAGGCFISGGTTGNLSALVTARQFARSQRGQHPVGQWRLACAAQAHSSVQAAASVLDAEMVIVPENERGQLTGEAVQSALTRSHDVFAVVASAGTTNAGIIDDLTGIADVCERYGIWMHVDGAYGGAALAAPSVRHLFAGIERADSFIVDPHKWLFATYDCCALLYRQPELARAAHAQQAGYLARLIARSGTRGTTGCTSLGEPAACRSGSAWPRTAPTGTSRRSSKPWQRLGRWQTGSGPSLSCHCCGSPYCLWCCSSGRDGTTMLTGAGRGDSHSRAGFCASRRGGKAGPPYGWPS